MNRRQAVDRVLDPAIASEECHQMAIRFGLNPIKTCDPPHKLRRDVLCETFLPVLDRMRRGLNLFFLGTSQAENLLLERCLEHPLRIDSIPFVETETLPFVPVPDDPNLMDGG